MNRIHTFAIALIIVGCSKNERPAETTSGTTYSTPSERPASQQNIPQNSAPESQRNVATPSVTQGDLDFINDAAQGALLEMQLGQVAARQGTSSSVKSMGQRLNTDHSAAYNELKAIASKKGLTLATTLDNDHQKRLDEMTKMSGAKFDKEYSDYMTEDHEKDVRAFEKAAREANDPELRAWANKTLPTLRTHLATAQDSKFKTNK